MRTTWFGFAKMSPENTTLAIIHMQKHGISGRGILDELNRRAQHEDIEEAKDHLGW